MARGPGMMFALAPRSLHGRAVLIIAWTVASILGPCAWYNWRAQETAGRAHSHLEQLLSAGLLRKEAHAWLPGTAPAGQAAPPLQALERWNACIAWVGAAAPDGSVCELRRANAPPLEQIAARLRESASDPQPFTAFGDTDPTFIFWRSPPPPDGLVLAVLFRADDSATGAMPAALRGDGYSLAVAALAAMIGLLIALLAVNRLLCAPLAASSAAALDPREWEALLNESAAPRELEEMLATMAAAQRELTHYRGKAAELQHSLEQRVDARTRAAVRAVERAERDAGTDELTGLLNRRAMNQDLPRLFEHARQTDTALSMAIIDLDNFKELNDRKGHQAGDDLLKFLGQLLLGTLGSGQQAYRYGGDEFLLLLPGADIEYVYKLAGRVQALFRQRAKTLAPLPNLPDLSIGIATLSDAVAEPAVLTAIADEAMYYAKATKRGIASAAEARAAIKRGEYKPGQRAQKRRKAESVIASAP